MSDIGEWLGQDPSDPAEVSATYDAWATAYDDDLTAWSYRAPTVVVDALLSRRPTVSAVLDVGCGTGLVGRELRSRGFAGRLRGLDLSEASLAIARRTGAYDVVAPADLQQPLPLGDAEVDATVCVGVMTYLPGVEAIWRELARVTRPGGVFVVTQREDLWRSRGCQDVVDRLLAGGVLSSADVAGPAAYLPLGYGGGAPVACYYLTGIVG